MHEGRRPPTVGIVGAGQLARMTAEAASALGIAVVVLAEHAADAAAAVCTSVIIGTPGDADAMAALATRCDVVTFDHEQVDLEILSALERDGVLVRPGTTTLEVAVDKAEMRTRLDAAGLPVPAYQVLGTPTGRQALAAVEAFAEVHGWPLVLKAARGGYDGKGVWPVADRAAAAAVCDAAAANRTPLLVEEFVAFDAELAVVVARRPGGETVVWPTVETAQVHGVCREVLYPGQLEPQLVEAGGRLGMQVAEVVGAVGILAVELFASGGRLLVNEVAARPHNTAHWTIEGSVTSQFENHLRAVLDLPLGDTAPAARHVACVNVFGALTPHDMGSGDPADASTKLVDQLAHALEVRGAHLHLYGKEPRPGRKLGHVTVCGDDAQDVRARAWEAAIALGTPVPDAIDLPGISGRQQSNTKHTVAQ